MKKIMDWLENSFSPKMNRFVQNPWVAAISGSMMKILPVIMVGALIFFYNAIKSWIPFLPDLGGVLTYTFMLTSLILAFFVGNQLMEKLDHPDFALTGGIAATIVFFISTCPQFGDVMSVDAGRFGPSGMFVAIVIGIFIGLVYHLYSKLHVLENTTVLPDFVVGWINQIIPMFFCVLTGVILTQNLGIDLYEAISSVFSPLQKLGMTLPGFVFMIFIQAFLYSLGISTWFVSAFTTPILMAGTEMNIAAVAAAGGDLAAASQIVCYENVYLLALATLGGTGCTLTLNVLMLMSKSKTLRQLGSVCIGPSIFNINEPIVFGTPVVYNPLLMLPMWLCSIVTPIMLWVIQSAKLLIVPAASVTTGQIPAPFGYIMVTGDWRALIWWVVFFAVTYFIWLPFFKVYEKRVLEQERAEEAE